MSFLMKDTSPAKLNYTASRGTMTSVSADSDVAVPRAKLKRFYWQRWHPPGETRSKCPSFEFRPYTSQGTCPLPALLSFLMGQKISIPSKFKFEFAYCSTVHATSRRRDVHYDAAESAWFLSVITAPEHFTVRSFILHPLPSPRTCFAPPPSRVKYTYVPDICASHSSRPFFPFTRD